MATEHYEGARTSTGFRFQAPIFNPMTPVQRYGPPCFDQQTPIRMMQPPGAWFGPLPSVPQQYQNMMPLFQPSPALCPQRPPPFPMNTFHPWPNSPTFPAFQEHSTHGPNQPHTGHWFGETQDNQLLKSMPVEQVNGQRICGPPTNYFGPPPSTDAEMFVRNIPTTIGVMELLKLFNRTGRVYKLRLLTNLDGTHRGIAFVQYFTKSETKHALYYFKDYVLPSGDKISAAQSRNNRRIVISGLPEAVTRDSVFREVSVLTPGITSLKLFDFVPGKGRSAIIKYESHTVALSALRGSLMGGTIAKYPIYAQWARPPRTQTGS